MQMLNGDVGEFVIGCQYSTMLLMRPLEVDGLDDPRN